MADEGSLELAPLRAKVVLDLTQFEQGMEQIADKTDTLKDVNVPVKIEININSDGVEEITEGVKEANQETEQLADNLEVVNGNVEQVAESTKVVTENLNEAKQVEQEMGRHDFIINYNGEQIHAMEQTVEELTYATHIYQDALTRLNSTESEFDETLSLNFNTIEEFNDKINTSIQSLKEMIDKSKGLKINLTEAQEALHDYIPLWEDLTKEQQEEFKSVGEVEYNLQALQTRFYEVSNAIDNLGDAMEKATENQQKFNAAVKQTKVDVSQYNQEAMEFIATAERQAEATQESSAQLRANGTTVAENATMVEKWGNDWWSSATMAVMGIEMVKGTFETYANDALEVQQSTIGLSHTFGTVGAESIENFCHSANNANLSLHDVLPYAQELGLALQQYGGTKTEVAGVAEEIISMANQLDVATGGAISFDEAVDALRADIGGQDFELEELGINISKTAEKQAALNSRWHEAYSKMSDYQKEVIDMQVVQNSLNKTFGQTSTYLDSTSGSYEKATAKMNNDLTYIALDLLPIAVVALDKIVEVMNKIKTIADKIKSNKWLMNKIEWFTKLALTGGTVALALAIVGKAFAMVTKRIRYVILATKDMVSIFKGASKFSEMRTGLGKVALAFKKMVSVIGSTTAKIGGILKRNITKVIIKLTSTIKPLALKLGTKIATLIASGISKSKIIANTLKNVMGIALDGVISSLSKFGGFIKASVIPTILDFLITIGPIGWTLLGLISVCTLVYEAWKHNWFGMRSVIEKVAKWLRSVGLGNIAKFVKAVGKLPSDIVGIWDKGWEDLIEIFNKSQDKTLQIQEKTNQQELKGAQDTWNGIKGIFADGLHAIENNGRKQLQTQQQTAQGMHQIWSATCSGLKYLYNNTVVRLMDDIANATQGISAFLQNMTNDWDNTVNWCLNTLGSAINDAKDLFNDFVGFLADIAQEIDDIISHPIKALENMGSVWGDASTSSFLALPSATGLISTPIVSPSTTNITNTITNLSTISAQTECLPTESIPTIGELHIHSPQTLDPLETYNQMQQWSINMANGLY